MIPVITEHASPKQHFRLSNAPKENYSSPAEAKADCWRRFGEIAIRLYGDETPFDASNPLHVALARIEARFSTINAVVAVGTQWYLIRRSKFGVEVKVTYTRRGDAATARNDSELVSQP